MRDLNMDEVTQIYGAGSRGCGGSGWSRKSSKGHSRSKCKGSKSKSRKHKSRSRRHGSGSRGRCW